MGNPKRRFLKRRNALIALAVIGITVPVLALAYAPYLPRVLSEGFPAAEWPAPGAFAIVEGRGADETKTGSLAQPNAQPNPWALRLFEESEGRALIVSQGGKVRLEHYADGFGPDAKFNSYSMVKSLIGALVLRAHAEGKIASLDDPIGKYLPNLGDTVFRATPVSAFLRMRSGIAFEPDGVKSDMGSGPKDLEATRMNPFGPMARLHFGGLDGVASRLRVEPGQGESFNYQNINTAVLGRLLSEIYGEPLEQILSEKIWIPAGAETAHWRRYAAGEPVSPYCCVYATARDWLKVGAFLARNGTATDPFLPPALMRKFLALDLPMHTLEAGHYGLHVYQNILDRAGEPLQGPFAYMLGNKGQTTYLMPQEDLIVVRFGEKVPLLHSTLYSAWRSVFP